MTTRSLETTSLPAAASRTQQTYDAVARLAQRLGPEARLPTFSELRQQFSVSVITLNKALTQLEAHKVLYRRHGVGIFVSPHIGQQNIAVVCSPRFFEAAEVSPFWKILLEQARLHVEARHHSFSLHFSAPDSAPDPLQDAFRRSVRDRQVQGVLGVGLGSAATDWILEQEIPLVAFAGLAPQRVEIDYHQIIRLGVEHLATNGCRRIGLWLNHAPTDQPDRFWRRPERLQESPLIPSYQEALALQGLAFDPALVRDSRIPDAGSNGPPPTTFWGQGYQMAFSVFGPGRGDLPLPDGIVSPSELFTQGVLVGLQRLGIGPGLEVRVASHANESSPVLQPWAEEITLLEVSPPHLARTMLAMLEAQMTAYEQGEEAPTKSVVSLAPTLRVPGRPSCDAK
ncbi:MAG: GntR family transcriptional regulator [Cytophagales bacterium]|nr:GntR family transcriptional regulator [Armatimonadota bacterium]